MYNVILDRNIMNPKERYIATKFFGKGVLVMNIEKWDMLEEELRERREAASAENQKRIRRIEVSLCGCAGEIDVLDKKFTVADFMLNQCGLSSQANLLLAEEGVYFLYNPTKVIPDEIINLYCNLFWKSEAGGEHKWIRCKLEKELDEDEVCD